MMRRIAEAAAAGALALVVVAAWAWQQDHLLAVLALTQALLAAAVAYLAHWLHEGARKRPARP